MFVGRTKELNNIKSALKNSNEHIIIYGNRRVGKTTLANKAAEESKIEYVSFECLKSSLKDNVHSLMKELVRKEIVSSYLPFDSFTDLFAYLDSLNKRIVFIIDEYPYLYVKNDNDEVDSTFQIMIDKYCSHFNVILSGSHIGMMKALVKRGNPLFGRFNTVISLKELNYLEASEFCSHLSNYDKAAFYAVFGGSPYILRQLNYHESLEYNIKNTFLNDMSSISMFVSENYTSDVSMRASANSIFEILGNSKEKHSRIEEALGYEHNGLLSKQLDLLVEMEFITRNEPINKIGNKKKASYSIKNNALRFYYTYVYGMNNALLSLGADEFYEKFISSSVNTFISYRFEDIARTFISILVKSKTLKDIYNIGTYYYDDPKEKRNGEFDIAVALKEGFDIIEAKYWNNKVDKETVINEIAQIKNITELDVKDYGFIAINGFEDDVPKLKYMFNGDDLYFVNK